MRKSMHNLLIVCGSGRNVGKTALVRSIINNQKGKCKIAAIKVSPHIHGQTKENLIWHSTNCNIFLENKITTKDSSLFLQAGANTSYYVETNDSMLETAFNKILTMIDEDSLIVCESGKLSSFIKPAILVFVESSDQSLNKKKTFRDFADLIIKTTPGDFEKGIKSVNSKIGVISNRWSLY